LNLPVSKDFSFFIKVRLRIMPEPWDVMGIVHHPVGADEIYKTLQGVLE
jgi:hypothetical protein